MTKTIRDLLSALSASMKNEPIPQLNEKVIEEATQQAVLPLISSEPQSFTIIFRTVRLLWEQQNLLKVFDDIPFLVLKGAAAAVYYPEPMRRAQGDIDIIVSPLYFDAAYYALIKEGFITKDHLNDDGRHVHFYKKDVGIELHRRFATLQSKGQEKKLDEWLYSVEPEIGTFGSYTFPMPPEQLNGIVLLTHINQHLEGGIGIRHILDWVMYVKHSLTDEKWPAFKELTDQLGLTTLAQVTTRLGQKYLDLNSDLTWCLNVNENTVDKLFDYVIACGNLGRKDRENTVVMVMSHGRGFTGFFKNLQNRGQANWKLAQQHKWLLPFAWIYQFFRYMIKGLRRGGISSFSKNLIASQKRNELLDELGATRLAFKE